jgi:hypothetical protein
LNYINDFYQHSFSRPSVVRSLERELRKGKEEREVNEKLSLKISLNICSSSSNLRKKRFQKIRKGSLLKGRVLRASGASAPSALIPKELSGHTNFQLRDIALCLRENNLGITFMCIREERET